MAGYVSGTYSEAEREDYIKVDDSSSSELQLQEMTLPQSEALLPSSPAMEEKIVCAKGGRCGLG